jgi:hypothetical protein
MFRLVSPENSQVRDSQYTAAAAAAELFRAPLIHNPMPILVPVGASSMGRSVRILVAQR